MNNSVQILRYVQKLKSLKLSQQSKRSKVKGIIFIFSFTAYSELKLMFHVELISACPRLHFNTGARQRIPFQNRNAGRFTKLTVDD